MLTLTNSAVASARSGGNTIGRVRKHLAKAMVGCTVDLLADQTTVAHGVVTGVRVEAGTPKIIVNGRTYDMKQVVTATAVSSHHLSI